MSHSAKDGQNPNAFIKRSGPRTMASFERASDVILDLDFLVKGSLGPKRVSPKIMLEATSPRQPKTEMRRALGETSFMKPLSSQLRRLDERHFFDFFDSSPFSSARLVGS